MHTSLEKIVGAFGAIVVLVGCGSAEPPVDVGGGRSSTDVASGGSGPTLGGALSFASIGRQCLISADCQPGSHCDLGECIQRCADETDCGGGRTCSLRGRCVDSAARAQEEPLPSSQKAGEVSVRPIATVLTEADRT